MRNNIVVPLLVVLLVAAALSGCARPKNWLTATNAEVRTFYFGETGAAKITVPFSLEMAGHSPTLLPTILTEVFQDRLRARGLAVGEAKPSTGGMTALDEFKVDGRRLSIEAYWADSGALLVTGAWHQEGRSIAHLHTWENMPAVPSQYYKDDESFYLGLKADIGPIIDKAIDAVLNDFAAKGLAKP